MPNLALAISLLSGGCPVDGGAEAERCRTAGDEGRAEDGDAGGVRLGEGRAPEMRSGITQILPLLLVDSLSGM